jgi:4-oxalocrotonate tautomerase
MRSHGGEGDQVVTLLAFGLAIALTLGAARLDLSRCAREVYRQLREGPMPEVYVHAIEGRSKEQKRALIKDITDAVVKNFGVTADAVLVEILESSRDNKAKGGVLFSER